MSFRRRALAVALALCVLPQGAMAFVRQVSNWDPTTLPIHYRVNTASAPASIGSATALMAIDVGEMAWMAPGCTVWRSIDDGTSTVAAATAADGANVFLWRTDAWPSELGDATVTIGVTTPTWTIDGYFIDADTSFNAVGFTWSTTGANGTVDTLSIVTHEEGHFLGLAHPPVPSAVMYATYSGGIKRALTSDDIAGVCTIYPSESEGLDAGISPVTGDPCAAYAACGQCTPVTGCGWCGSTEACVTGSDTGPVMGSCSAWVWDTVDCPNPVGGQPFGGTCVNPTDCASGGVCIPLHAGGASFCSQSCVVGNLCSCPRGYQCQAGTDSTGAPTAFCTPGPNACATLPQVDAGTWDATVQIISHPFPGCGCIVADSSSPSGASVLFAALGILVAGRRRRVA